MARSSQAHSSGASVPRPVRVGWRNPDTAVAGGVDSNYEWSETAMAPTTDEDQHTHAAPGAPSDAAFALEGGWLCLGFCNTVGWHSGAHSRATLYADQRPGRAAEPVGEPGGTPVVAESWSSSGDDGTPDGSHDTHERLNSYEDVVAWFERKGVIRGAEAGTLRRAGQARPEQAEQVRLRAIALRETLYHLFAAIAAGKHPGARDLVALDAWLPQAYAQRRLAYRRGRFAWEGRAIPDALDRLLWPVVWSAADLLTSGLLARVRECQNEPCGWLFVDMSRNRSRRWCDMRDCGNRVKARRHYARLKQTRDGSQPLTS
jgi:predicted RNA-binding Zn ribbon-like protein